MQYDPRPLAPIDRLWWLPGGSDDMSLVNRGRRASRYVGAILSRRARAFIRGGRGSEDKAGWNAVAAPQFSRLSPGAIRLLATLGSRSTVGLALWASHVLAAHGEVASARSAILLLRKRHPHSSRILMHLAMLTTTAGGPLPAEEAANLVSSDMKGVSATELLTALFKWAGPSQIVTLEPQLERWLATAKRRDYQDARGLLALALLCEGQASAEQISSTACLRSATALAGLAWARGTRRRDVLHAFHRSLTEGEASALAGLGRARLQALRQLVYALKHSGDLGLAYSAAQRASDLSRDPRSRRLAVGLRHDMDRASAEKEHVLRPIRKSPLERSGGGIPYLLHSSLPHTTKGYATRTHGLLRSLTAEGWGVTGFTRTNFPLGSPGEVAQGRSSIRASDLIDDVLYFRTRAGHGGNASGKLVRRLLDLDAAERWQAVHSASNYIYGLAAADAGQRLGIPSLYEVRGFWEMTAASLDPGYEETEGYRLAVRKETEACLAVDHVLAITQAARDVLIARGIDSSRVTVVPNGVDTSRFTPRGPEAALKEQLGFGGRIVVGYVGSVLAYEGLAVLVEALRMLRDRGVPVALLIVGDGPQTDALKKSAREWGLGDDIRFTGRVPHEDVEDYYSIIDITPFPRLPLPVTEVVSPIKPFESMALEKAVVVSSVAALAEIVEHEKTGLVFPKGDAAGLAEAIARLVEDRALRKALGANARQWVLSHRDWSVIAKTVSGVYESLGMSR